MGSIDIPHIPLAEDNPRSENQGYPGGDDSPAVAVGTHEALLPAWSSWSGMVLGFSARGHGRSASTGLKRLSRPLDRLGLL